ncbi:MAG: molybdopterin molybdenumtransferase MoeA, partial [Chitinophagaceae bacterium]
MISVEAAKKIILENVHTLAPKKMALLQAAGLVTAEDIYASIHIPSYDQSSMDGYALSFSDLENSKPLKITGEMAAGSAESFSLLPGNAVRIFTGAAVPPGADTVVMQEKVRIENGGLVIADENLKKGSNVRARGSEIKSGELAVAINTTL